MYEIATEALAIMIAWRVDGNFIALQQIHV